jgi:hypothetical protein
MTLLELLKKEPLPLHVQAQVAVVLSRLRSTGEYLIGKKLQEMTLNGRAEYRT